MMMATLLPPPQYDVPPPMPVIEKIMGWDELQKFCTQKTGRILIPGQYILGCAHREIKVCYVWYTGNAATLRHERAHCAGWPANHPGGW
jgi:hypothetical protein